MSNWNNMNRCFLCLWYVQGKIYICNFMYVGHSDRNYKENLGGGEVFLFYKKNNEKYCYPW